MYELVFAFLLFPALQDKIEEVIKSPPAPTAEIKKLVDDLGDDEFRVREKAHQKLKGMGYKAITALEAGLKSKDLEIVVRCRRILDSYYCVYSDDKDNPMPSVWYLPDEYRFKNGRDIAKELYMRHRKKYNKANFRNPLEDDDWQNGYVASEALNEWKLKQMRQGVKREDMKKILNDTAKRMSTHWLEMSGEWKADKNKWVNNPPGPAKAETRLFRR
jgi:hypothetical protein